MDLLKKVFGKSPQELRPVSSIVKVQIQQDPQGSKMLTGTCDICGNVFHYSNVRVTIAAAKDNYALDLGGYCGVCGKLVCQRHAKFVPGEAIGTTPTWEIGCAKCGTRLTGVIPRGGLPREDLADFLTRATGMNRNRK